MPDFNFDQLRHEVDLVALIQQRVALKHRGRDWKGLCPFHADRHPSLTVNPQKGLWRCWVCNIGGDAIDWVRIMENCSTAEAMRTLQGIPSAPPPPRLLEPYELATRSERHVAYQALLSAAGLSTGHYQALRARGLSDEHITAAGYATLPGGSRSALLDAMQLALPDLRGIPGIDHHLASQRWQLRGAPGLLIPVRDRFGHIQACQIRRDHGESRYQWLTSTPREPGWSGVSPGTPIHIAGHPWIRPSATWWVTEGPLKADVAAFFLKRPVLGIPGVALWPRVAQAVSQWHPATVILAFDQDVAVGTRERVQDAQRQLGIVLADAGIRVFVAEWPEGPKGIDDAVAGAARLTIVPWGKEGDHAPHA